MTDRVSGQTGRTILFSLAAWAGALLLFWRAIRWIAGTTLAREQIGHAAIVLLFALAFLLRERQATFSLRFGRRASWFYAIACLMAALAGLLQQPLLMLCALGVLAGAFLLFVFGDSVLRLAFGFGLAFSGFTFLSVLFPLADWPLRLLAGRTAMWFLGALGHSVQLALAGDPVCLILVDGGRPFEVAPECNGFGIISGCILLALLLVFSRRLRLTDKILALALAPLLGLLSNALRIFLIVLLAPLAGAHYFLLHEIVGIALFFGTLGGLWWLVEGLPERRDKRSREAQRKSPIS